MKNLYLLCIFIIGFGFNSMGQSGEWGYVLDINPINTNNRHGKSSGSGTHISIYPYDSNGNLGERIYFTGSFRHERNQWARFTLPMQVKNITVRVPRVRITHRVDWEGGGSNTANNDLYLFPSGFSTFKYNYFRVCNGSNSTNCQSTQSLFNQMQGHVDVYTFPKNINISLRSSSEKGVSAEDKVRIEAPAGYDPEVYKWVYKKDITDSNEAWKSISNSSLNGNRILEASLADIYGSGYMNEGVVDFCSNTYIALEYDVYQSTTVTRTKERSNVIVVSNKLTAPKIVSVVGGKTMCPGYSNGKITVTVDRPLLSNEIITFYASTGTLEIQRDKIQTSPTTFEIIDLAVGEYTVALSTRIDCGGGHNYSTNVNDTDHKRTGISITEADTVSYTVNDADKKHILCKGGNDGSFKVTAAGGTAPYTLWFEPDDISGFIPIPYNGLEATGLKAGIYRYYITDANNCEPEDPEYGGILYKTVTLTEPAEYLAANFLANKTADPTGKGRSDGYITVKITGGIAPYTVVWQEKTSGVVPTTVDNSIAGESKLYNIPSGTYSVMVTDSKGCMLSDPKEFTLYEPDALRLTIIQYGDILCYGDATVSLTVSVTGGNGGPYTYIWSKKINGEYKQISTSSNPNNLEAGDYKVFVSDGNTPPNEGEIEYSIPGPFEFVAFAIKNDVGCKNENTGSITFEISGGIAPYHIDYKKSGASAYSRVTFNSTTYSITNLNAGNYEYYVTDANGCMAKTGNGNQITIIEPDATLEIISSEQNSPSGDGRNDGSITIKVGGGITFTTGNAYIIIWKNGSGTVIPSEVSIDENGIVTSTIKNLVKGIYHVEVQDNSSGQCNTIKTNFNLTGPPPLSVTLEVTKRIDCFGNNTAEITAKATGGIPRSSDLPYTYKWYKVESGNDILIPNENIAIINNVGAGSYKVKIEDGSTPSNTAEVSIVVSQPAPVEASIVMKKNVSCFEGSDGTVHISVSGGSGGYKLFCKNDFTDADYRQYSVNLQDNKFYLNNLPAGKYSMYIQDVNGCPALIEGQNIAQFVLIAPDKPISVVYQQLISPSGTGRSDGGIMITVDGGTPLASGDKYIVTWKDVNGILIMPENSVNEHGQFTSKISNLYKGEYHVEIKDKSYQDLTNGCYLSTVITLNDPPPLTVTLENTKPVKCFGNNSGELVAHARGGIPFLTGLPYQYTWYRIENDIETLLENETDSILSNIPAGQYIVKIADGSSITNYTESAIYEITQPNRLVMSIDTRMIMCHQGNDGYILMSVTGGSGSYKLYHKLNGIDADYHETANSINSTFNLNNLQAGIYSVYVLDGNLCYASFNGVEIAEIELTQPDKALAIVLDTIYDPTGYGLSNGEIHIQVDGGTPGYTIIWKDDKGNVLSAEDSDTGGVFSSVLTGLNGGEYTVEVRDANYSQGDGSNNTPCILIKEYELIQPDELVLKLEETHYISCYQMLDGEITAHVKGGVKNKDGSQPPYKYTWYREEAGIFVVMPDRKNLVLSNIPAGTYQLEVEDYSRQPNKTSAIYQIVQPEILSATSGDVQLTCGEVATISVTVSGGTKPYTYKWNTGGVTPELTNMAPGKYMVWVTDARGCEVQAIANVISPSNLSVSAKINHPVCYQSTNGSIETQVTGGTTPYTYRWNTGETTKDIANISAGIYTVVVTGRDGCSFSESFELIDPEQVKVDLGEDITLCINQTYLLSPQVEDPKTVFNWMGPNGFQSANPKVELSRAGTYRLTITDSKGCQATDEVEVFVTDYGISAEMVVATDVFVNDTIILVNISSPEPERIEWLFSEKDPVEIVETTPEYAKIIYKQAGNFSAGMRSHVKDCYQDVIKILNATVSDGSVNDNFGQAGIIAFTVYPNPNDGNYKVKVELERQGMARLRLLSLNHGGTMDDRTLNGSKLYEEQYQMHLSTGVYILLLETASGRKSQKIIIK